MNAYELADELWENYLDNNECEHGFALSSGCHNDDCKEQALYNSANMLRQQAGLIDYYKVRDSSHLKTIKAMSDRISTLENQLDKCSHHEAVAHQGGYEVGYAEGLKKASEK